MSLPSRQAAGEVALSLATSVLLALGAYALSAWRTSAPAGPPAEIEPQCASGPFTREASGGLRLQLRDEPRTILFERPAGAPPIMRFTTRFQVRGAGRVAVQLRYGERDAPQSMREGSSTSFPRRGPEDGFTISLGADDAYGLAAAEQIQLVFQSGAALELSVAPARLLTETFSERLARTFARVVRPLPLSQRSNNLCDLNKIQGRSHERLLWSAFALTLASLGLRRWLLRRRIALGTHAAVCALAFFGLLDLRNSVDLLERARLARSNAALAPDLAAQLRDLDSPPWVAETLAWLRAQSAQPQYLYADVSDAPGPSVDLRMLLYYARPTRPVDDPELAELLIADGERAARWAATPGWQAVERTSDGRVLFERRP